MIAFLPIALHSPFPVGMNLYNIYIYDVPIHNIRSISHFLVKGHAHTCTSAYSRHGLETFSKTLVKTHTVCMLLEVKKEVPRDDDGLLFSPETKALIKGLGDSPESLALKAEIIGAANELKRGD